MHKRRLYWDIESNGFLDESTVDYSASPWKLKPNFIIHCIVFIDIDTDEEFEFVGEDVYKHAKQFVIDNAKELIAHNSINYDHLVCFAALDMDYTVEPDTVCGIPITITDTLVMSKTLNPDRQAHSIEYFGSILGQEKINWRARAIELGLIAEDSPKGAEFQTYHPDMLVYCKRDCHVGIKVWRFLWKEWGEWNWDDAYRLEKAVAEIITRQQHRGFFFNADKAVEFVKDLDEKMEVLRAIVEPLIPPKPLGKTAAKEFIPPSTQFKKDGTPNAHITKWVTKHGGELTENEGKYSCTLYDKQYTLPIAQEPIVTQTPAKISDTTHIKGWLVELGWIPTAWKERDLTVDFRKKKLDPQKYAETVDRYVEQTLNSPFKHFRLEQLGLTEARFKMGLLKHDIKRPLKVYTNPTLTVGQEKEIDPALLEMSDKFAYAKEISDYLTFSHRRNSILGGGIDPDDEDEEAEKGYLANYRETDSRIPTPADTCGAGTSRFKHRLVANIPRVSSLYGKEMRSLFGVNNGQHYQVGYDFDGLESRIEGHYTWKYDNEDHTYCMSLLGEKPNDVHCYDEATEILTTDGWKTFGEITKDSLVAQWEDGVISFVKPLEIVWQKYEGPMISMESQAMSMLVTPNHRQIFKHDAVNARWKTTTANEIMSLKRVKFPVNGEHSGSLVDLDENALSLLLAVQSDGHYAKDCSAIALSFVKERKVNRFKSIVTELDIPHTYYVYERKGRTEHCFRLNAGVWSNWVRDVLGEKKQLPWDFLNLPLDKKEFLLAEMGIWDGTMRPNGDMVLDQRNGDTVDVIQALAITSGRASVKNVYFKSTTFSEDYVSRCYVSMKSKKTTTTSHPKQRKIVAYSGMIGCVAVPSTFVVVRRNGRVIISGNTLTAKKITSIIEEDFSRQSAKQVKYAASYGAMPKRIAKSVGCSLELAEKIFHAFWEAAAPLARLNEKLTQYWENIGDKKFILGIDGRKIPTRSKSALINSLFQSGGVICAKRAMVIHDRKLKAAGLSVDFWRDDWKNKQFCQQMIAYHDESQLEVSKKLVTWKLFKEEAEAKEFKKVNPTWSDVGHSAKGYYVGYCEAGVLAVESVMESGKYYNLNVDLTAGYMLGLAWDSCH